MKVLNHDWDALVAAKANITAAEIENQPKVWRRLADALTARLEEMMVFMERMRAVPGLRVVFTGAGSSAFIGESMSLLLMAEQGLRSEVVHTTEAVATPEAFFFDAPTLLVSYSRSGSSPESCGAIHAAERKVSELHNLVLVCNADSELGRIDMDERENKVFHIPQEACDDGFAMTCSVSCMALATWTLFAGSRAEAEKRIACIRALADSAEEQLPQIQRQAAQIAQFDYDRIVYLGFGALRGLAREGAVKSQELTCGRVCAAYDTPTGFRHGPKTILNGRTLTVLMASPLKLAGLYDRDMIAELCGRAPHHVAVVAREDLPYDIQAADWQIRYKPAEAYALSEIQAYIFSLLFLQVLSFEKSCALGVTTDNPCPGGEVNRVVQGVSIHG